jgi:UDP-N-acetylmuramate dehydrogenase
MHASVAEPIADRIEAAAAVLGSLARRDVPLAPFTTYKVGGSAALFAEATSIDDLAIVARALGASQLPLLIVGRGSNLLVNDAGFAGIAVSIAEISMSIDIDEQTGIVDAGSGVLLPVLARRTVKAGLTGFEWAVGVPGSVGGAVKMNAGGHGSDISASLIDVTVADLAAAGDAPDAELRLDTIAAADLGLRFRGSALPATSVVVSARLQLATGADPEAGDRELSEIVAWRRANQPGGQNAGSVFVNPVPGEVSAGALIDEIGLRGHRIGSASVSDKHANFIQADVDGSANDVVDLMKFVRQRVLDETGYALRSEIKLIGFEEPWD